MPTESPRAAAFQNYPQIPPIHADGRASRPADLVGWCLETPRT